MTNFPARVYYISCPTDPTVLLGLDVQLINNERLEWFDTIKERIMFVEKIIDSRPEHFIFQRKNSEGGGLYTFVPLTMTIYEKSVKHHLKIPTPVASEEELFKNIEATIKNAW